MSGGDGDRLAAAVRKAVDRTGKPERPKRGYRAVRLARAQRGAEGSEAPPGRSPAGPEERPTPRRTSILIVGQILGGRNTEVIRGHAAPFERFPILKVKPGHGDLNPEGDDGLHSRLIGIDPGYVDVSRRVIADHHTAAGPLKVTGEDLGGAVRKIGTWPREGSCRFPGDKIPFPV